VSAPTVTNVTTPVCDHEWVWVMDDPTRGWCDVCDEVMPESFPAVSAIDQIVAVLYPNGDEDHEWDADTLDQIAFIVSMVRRTPLTPDAS